MMNKRATADEVLAQIRALDVEEREYVEAELTREAFEAGRKHESDALRAEIRRRAKDAIERPGPGLTLDEAVAGARGAVAAVRDRKSRG
jgi:hypothetical protein